MAANCSRAAGQASGPAPEFTQRRKLLFGGSARAAHDAQENFFEGELFARRGGTRLRLRGPRLHAGAELFERALRDELAAINDGDVAAEAFDDFEHVRGEENRGAARDHAVQHRLERAGGDGVHALERLVEKQNLWAVNDGGGEGQFLLHAVRVVGDQGFRLIGELHEVEEFHRALGRDVPAEAVHVADEIQIFGAGETAEKRDALRHDTDLTLHFDWIIGEIDPENFHAAGRRREEAGEHFDRGGFAGAVGAEEAEELAGGDAKVHIVDGDEVSEAARKMLGGDGWNVHRSAKTLA